MAEVMQEGRAMRTGVAKRRLDQRFKLTGVTKLDVSHKGLPPPLA